MPTRRSFIKQSSFAATATLFGSRLMAFPATRELVGVQLYSVRDEMGKDPKGTLEQIAKMGYKNVEHANYVNGKFYGYAPAEFKKLLDGLGLKMPSGHTVLNNDHWDTGKKEFTDKWKRTVDDAALLGQEFVISPWLDKTWRSDYDTMVRYMDVFNRSGELCQKAGMKFGYHNHDFEFSEKLNDQTLFDIILQRTDPALVIQQLDIGNMYHAGARALDIMNKYPGRFVSMHVKDEIKSEKGEMGNHYESTVLGKGLVPVKEVVDLGRKSGTLHFIVEQESYQGKTPLNCVQENLSILKKWGYV